MSRIRSAYTNILILMALCVSMIGCVKPVKFPRYLTVDDVIGNVRCGLYRAIENADPQFMRSGAWPANWSASFNVTLEVIRQGVASTDLTFVVPYDLGTSSTRLTAGLLKNSKSRLTFDFGTGANLKAFMTDNWCSPGLNTPYGKNLAGETGMSVWLEQPVRGLAVNTKRLTSFTYNLDFVVDANGSLIPSFNSLFPSGRRLSGILTLSRQRKDTNTLKVAFTRVSTAETDLDVLKDIRDRLNAITTSGSKAEFKYNLVPDVRNGAVDVRKVPITREGPRIDEPSPETQRRLDNLLTREVIRDIR